MDSVFSVIRRSLVLLVPLVSMLVSPARAQSLSFVEDLFDQVNSFTFAAHMGGLLDEDELDGDCGPIGLCGLGTEIFLDLYSSETVLLELALGTNYIQGFRSNVEGMDFHGAVRSIPTLAIYTTHQRLFGQGFLQPFAGLSFGLAELWNARIYDDEGRRYTLDGDTFTQGITVGVLAQITETAGLFAQVGYDRRAFFSVDWGFPDGVDAVPAGWPRELDLSTWNLTLGWQFFMPSN